MKITQALNFFNTLTEQSTNKSESKIIDNFTQILSNLKSRELSEKQLTDIEHHLASLDLTANTENRKKYLKGKLTELTTFLRKEYSFITAGYYTNIGLVYGLIFGSGVGLSLGTAFGAGTGTAIGLPIGTGIGMAIGIMFGAAKDAEAKKQNLVLS